MIYFRDMWAVIATAAMAWLTRIDNNFLNIIVNLLTILVIVIGLVDWAVRRFAGEKKKKSEEGRRLLEMVENTQKPFKTVSLLDNPVQAGESIGKFVDKISTKLKGGSTMKKFFKWVWYNKEQLFSILYSILMMALSQVAVWTDLVSSLLPELEDTSLIIVQVAICAVSVLATALTVRNVCVTYGLSSIDTIDKVLEERAKAAANNMTADQKKTLKSYITTLQSTLDSTKAELAEKEKALAVVTTLFNADSTLVADYNMKKSELNSQIEKAKAVIANVEAKIAEYKAQLSGKNAS